MIFAENLDGNKKERKKERRKERKRKFSTNKEKKKKEGLFGWQHCSNVSAAFKYLKKLQFKFFLAVYTGVEV